MSKYNLVDIFEGMSSDEMSKAKEADRLENHPERDIIKKIQALMAKEKKDVKEGEAIDLAIEASQKKAGIEVDESFKSLAKKVDKQKGVDKEYAGKIAGKIANIKRKGGGSGPTAKQKKRMNEVRIDDEVAERIEGLTNRELKRKFLFAFEDLYSDLIEEDPFHAEDVINHLNNEMHKHLDAIQAQGDKLANTPEIPMFKGTRDALDDISIREENKRMNEGVVKSIMQALRDDAKATDAEIKQYMTSLMKAGDAFDDIDDYVEDFKEYISSKSLDEVGNTHIKEEKKVDFIRALKVDANGTSIEIKSYLESLKQSGDKFDSVDDYVEDFKNYVADKALQEHFGRFMKDYQ